MYLRHCTCAVGGDGNSEEIDSCVKKDPQIHAEETGASIDDVDDH